MASYRFTTPAERAATGAWWSRTDESVIGPINAAVAEQMAAEERRVAAGALVKAGTFDERIRTTTGEAPAAADKVEPEPWLPPWKFWLVAAPGWIPLCLQMFAARIVSWRSRRAARCA